VNIILVRHPETIANQEGVYQGQNLDTELTEMGEEQIKALVKWLNKKLVDKVVSSPANRCRQTAEEVAKVFSKSVEEEPLLWEINHGLWEGKTKAEVEENFPEEVRQWKEKPGEVLMPGGESLVDVSSRVQRWFEKLDQLNGEVKHSLLVVSHDAVIRTILVKLLRRELDEIWMFELDNGGVTTIEWGKMPQVVEINRTEHLKGIKGDLDGQAL
jgi:broad specificity phosphatase PhoE